MLKALLGDPNARKLKRYKPDVVEINLLEEEIQPLPDEALVAKTGEFRERLEKGESLDDILPKPLPWCGKLPSGCWGCATSTCS
jgi:preprotein translocase subunit SecA